MNATDDPNAPFQPLPAGQSSIPMSQIIQELAEQRLNLQFDLTLLKEQYELQAKELEHFKNLATPEQRQLYRILKNN